MSEMFRFCSLWKPRTEGKLKLHGGMPFEKDQYNAGVEELKAFIRSLDGKGIRVLIFKNENKKSDKAPDYNLCLAVDEPKEAAPANDEVPF